MKLLLTIFMCFSSLAFGDTDPNDLEILRSFEKGLGNSELLKWPSDDNDPCGPPLWPHVYCVGSRVSQIQVQNMSLSGTLPQNFNQLTKLVNLGLQRNNFVGKLPSFSGLSELRYAYLGYNQFDTIPSDFFDGLTSLQVLSLDYNPLNKTTGWILPIALSDSSQLMNLSLMECNLINQIPDFLGKMPSLTALKLSYNNLSGELPKSFSASELQILWLNNQYGTMLSGDINVIASMFSLGELWLHGNSFTGKIPVGITGLSSLTDLQLNDNHFVGPIPQNVTDMNLKTLKVEHNMLSGPIPKLNSSVETDFSGNSFCQTSPGILCSPEVAALLDFLDGVKYPSGLTSSWSGNAPCGNSWLGIACSSGNKVSVINLGNLKLNGTLSPSLGKLDSVEKIMLGGNNLSGKIPVELTSLKSLKVLDLTGNNFNPPVPKFDPRVSILIDGNSLLNATSPLESPPSENRPQSPSNNNRSPPASPASSNTAVIVNPPNTGGPNHLKLIAIVAPAVGFALLSLVSLFVYCCFCTKRKSAFQAPSSFVVHPRDPSEPDDIVKIAIAHNSSRALLNQNASSSQSISSGLTRESQVIEAGNLVISVEVLRAVTDDFAPGNVLGRGGFGVVYKGVFADGTIIAVKRMEVTTFSSNALDEFEAEIAVLSKLRHRHLVSLLGYSIEGHERLLVYEYMPQGALSKHLFHWERLNLEPLSWKRRLNIALDVARGMEYLHSMAHQSFIHRDLKSSNILLGDDLRAKVSDFGLVKLAPDGKKSVATRLAGTFGYLAPEYAVTGKITTKADVFSFGVVLMELVTGLTALDEDRPEEQRYLARWFWQVKSRKETLMAAVDPVLDVTEETFESISIIAELAGHCTAREPNQRPNFGHVVNILAPQIDKWKPAADDEEEYSGIDYSQPLTLMVKDWQAAESIDHSFSGLDDSKGSIPARPTGFAESFTSADGR